MGNKASDTFAFDLENRLDDFFSDPEPAQETEPEENTSTEPDPGTSLKELKSTILAIDWEITDEALDAFIGQVNELAEAFKTNKINQTLLKLLDSLGKYMRKHKSAAHPDSIKRIMAVYSALEEIVENRGLTTAEKEKILNEEVQQFKQLKAKIAENRPGGKPKSKAAATARADIDAVLEAINSLKTYISAELGAVRKTIAKLNSK